MHSFHVKSSKPCSPTSSRSSSPKVLRKAHSDVGSQDLEDAQSLFHKLGVMLEGFNAQNKTHAEFTDGFLEDIGYKHVRFNIAKILIDLICEEYSVLSKSESPKVQSVVDVYDFLIVTLYEHANYACQKPLRGAMKLFICRLNSGLVRLTNGFNFDPYRVYRECKAEFGEFLVRPNNLDYLIKNNILNGVEQFSATGLDTKLSPAICEAIYRNLLKLQSCSRTDFSGRFLRNNMEKFTFHFLRSILFCSGDSSHSHEVREDLCAYVKYRLADAILGFGDDVWDKNLSSLSSKNRFEELKNNLTALNEYERKGYSALNDLQRRGSWRDDLFSSNFKFSMFGLNSSEILHTLEGIFQDKDSLLPCGACVCDNTTGGKFVLILKDPYCFTATAENLIPEDKGLRARRVDSTLNCTPVSHLSIKKSEFKLPHIRAIIKRNYNTVSEYTALAICRLFTGGSPFAKLIGITEVDNLTTRFDVLGLSEILMHSFSYPGKQIISQTTTETILELINKAQFTERCQGFCNVIFNNYEFQYLFECGEDLPRQVQVHLTQDKHFDFKRLAGNQESLQCVIRFDKETNVLKAYVVSLSGYPCQISFAPHKDPVRTVATFQKAIEQSRVGSVTVDRDVFFTYFEKLNLDVLLDSKRSSLDACIDFYNTYVEGWFLKSMRSSMIQNVDLPEIKKIKQEIIQLIEALDDAFEEIERKLKQKLGANYWDNPIYLSIATGLFSVSGDDVLGQSVDVFRFLGIYFLIKFISGLALESQSKSLSALEVEFINSYKRFVLQAMNPNQSMAELSCSCLLFFEKYNRVFLETRIVNYLSHNIPESLKKIRTSPLQSTDKDSDAYSFVSEDAPYGEESFDGPTDDSDSLPDSDCESVGSGGTSTDSGGITIKRTTREERPSSFVRDFAVQSDEVLFSVSDQNAAFGGLIRSIDEFQGKRRDVFNEYEVTYDALEAESRHLEAAYSEKQPYSPHEIMQRYVLPPKQKQRYCLAHSDNDLSYV